MLNNFHLYCPKCKIETFNSCKTIQSVSYHRARRFRRRADNPLASRHTDYRLFFFLIAFSLNAYLVNTTRPLYSALRRKTTVLKQQFQAAVFFLKNENTGGVLRSPFFKDTAVSGRYRVSIFVFFHSTHDLHQLKKA